MVPTDLFTIVPGTLPGGDGYCFLGWQRYQVDVLTRAQIVQRNDVGATFWNVSASTPSADKRIYPWLNLNNGKVYFWSFTYGVWISPRPYSFGQIIPSELGITEVQLWGVDGGDSTDPRPTLPNGSANPAYVAPTPVTGAMWMVAHSLDGRFPLGAGTIPGTTPPITVAQGATIDSAGVSGEYQHTLTEQEGGLGAHVHAFGKSNNAAGSGGDDAFFRQMAMKTVPAYQGTYVTGSDGVIQASLTDADLFTLPPLDAAGAIPTPTAFNKMPQYEGVLFAVPTTRQFYTVPG